LRLQVEPADGPPFQRLFDADSMVIGRASSSDLALADPFLSRHHARLFRRGDDVMIEDLGSRNGTELNGTPVLEPTAVKPGDVVKVSGSLISIFDDNEEKTLDPDIDWGATVFKPASELLREVSTITRPEQVQGEDALRRYASRLRLMNEIHEALSTSISLDDLLQLILDRAFEQLRPEEGVIFLRRGNSFVRAAQRTSGGKGGEIPLSRHLIEEVCNKSMAALVLDTATDQRFSAAESIISSGLRSLIAAPLLDSAGALGMLVLSSRVAVREFIAEDLELLVSLASIAALKIRNASLTEEAIQRKRMEQDLALARRIQESLLPSQLPVFAGWELFAENIPSRGVSGDYYNLLARGEGRECVLLVTDVSGKGVPASLLTASLEALSAAPIESGCDSAEICDQVSRRLHRRSPPEKYATAFVAVIDSETGACTFTNAGHNPALLVRADGTSELLQSSGMPLGLVATAAYVSREVTLSRGELLVVYTDGFIEAESPEGDEYGLDRFRAVVAEARNLPLPELGERINTDLDTFTHQAPPTDDRTLVILRRLSSPQG
jgi:serine phosphatase RsbU (regulator of sigma subunit)